MCKIKDCIEQLLLSMIPITPRQLGCTLTTWRVQSNETLNAVASYCIGNLWSRSGCAPNGALPVSLVDGLRKVHLSGPDTSTLLQARPGQELLLEEPIDL